MTSAVAAAWSAAGRPEPNWQGKARTARTPPDRSPGICALTGTRGDVVPISSCVSDLFTGWDRLAHLDRPDVGFSLAAAWAFRERVAMQRPHGLIARRWVELDPAGLYIALEHLTDTDFICVPQSRQKHLLPWATFGCVRTDDETLRWGETERRRLGVYAELRAIGFNSAALTEPVPRHQVLTRLDSALRRHVLTVWDSLDMWRAHPVYLDVAAIATRPAKGAA